MTGLARPCGDDAYISDSWGGHNGRTPPSSEPGTDYAVGVGTHVLAAGAGTVVDVKTSNSSATGRYVTVQLDDGRSTRSLHLSEVYVGVGYRVQRGAVLAASGASANGSDWGVGAHVHQTLWPGQPWQAETIDFEAHASSSEPEGEPNVPISQSEMDAIAARVWQYSMSGGNSPDDPNAVPTETGGERLRNIRRSTDGLKGRTDATLTTVKTIDKNTRPSSDEASSTSLSSAAWVVGAFVAVIGVVEVVRFILDVVV